MTPEASSGAAASPRDGATWPDSGRINLPKPLTSFIGRQRELAQAKRLLQGSYLVTLTGPGGSGKTRLGIAVAADVASDYPDGVYFVSLAPVRDPRLVPSTIAQSIGLQDARDVPLMEHLISQLRERKLLIVLDNFEHLLAGAPVVTRLLRETSAVRILVSSRSPLHVSGEQECPVPPLAVPDLDARPTASSLAGCESVRLFAEREVLRLTHALVHYGTLTQPVRRRARDAVVPALGRSRVIQRRAARRMSQVYASYPPGPLVRPSRERGEPRPGHRMPDLQVRSGGQATTLHDVLRGGRHVLIAPAAQAARVLSDPALRPFRSDLDIVTRTPAPGEKGTRPFILIRPDGHVAALGRPGGMDAVTGYLRDLFTRSAGHPDKRQEGGAPDAACVTATIGSSPRQEG